MSLAIANQTATDSDGFGAACRCITAKMRKSQRFAIFLVHVRGIDRYCAVHGHADGAALLEEFQARLTELAQPSGVVARMGMRKFAVVLDNLRNAGHMRLAAQKIARMLDAIVGADEQSRLGAIIGATNGGDGASDAPELLRRVEIAVLDGRRKNASFNFYEPDTADEILLDWGLEKRLAQAIEDGALEIHFQPKLELATDRIVGAEALMRWSDPDIGPISPDVFIDLAETTGQITDLTHFAIQRSCRQVSAWKATLGSLNIAVNVTPSLIGNTEIVDAVRSASNIWDLEPDSLTLEVTENALMADREAAHRVLTAIRDFGARVSIDDFGTGYSSLSYLKKIPADELKIDRTFVMGMLADRGDYKIVEHTIGIAKSFGLSVVAEGVETSDMLVELQRLGCDYAQGYFICRPVGADAFEEFCRKRG